MDHDDTELTAGGFFEVPSVDDVYRETKEVIQFDGPPKDIPPGRYAQFRVPAATLSEYATRPRNSNPTPEGAST
ncbi:hypothetical protein [Sulfobacillus harzensis]|uniref:Uncharacterized protein n=1 Tax=Sulfobacillus harzensis TaxID=2729629 RepID=A0A7Y0L510_9FIRM|nr:hypothetical protein [Sulfobacillus harzensis]NMP23438.1 hypothetical protein [Sulfobacillus harzensis]